jgi:uncharacterized membrane protein
MVRSRADIEVLAQLPPAEGGHPLLVSGHYGRGRTIAWTSDIGPHWVGEGFAQWHGFGKLWINALSWLTGGG